MNLHSRFCPRAVLSIGAAIAALSLQMHSAHADATTGVWPNLSVPLETKQANASSDAALIIGIDEYDALPHIPGAADNARDWEKYMLFGRHLPPERIALLTDHEATVEAIAQAAKDMSSRVLEGGTLHIIFIGHGAPGAAGAKGLLLGSDARPSDRSFDARSISYDKLIELTSAGKQAETVIVLDACFSGVSNEGKTLIPSVQPVLAVSLVETPKTVILTAGSSAEYAGALPGSQRPAFSYLVLGGLRGWADADHDGKISAKETVTFAKLVLRSLPNNHTQTPSLVTSTPEVSLDQGPAEPAPDLSKIRAAVETWKPPSTATDAEIYVAAKCLEDRVLGVDDGLVVTVDGAALPPTARRKDGSASVTALRYSVAPGVHELYIKAARCDAFVESVTFVAGESVYASGALKNGEPLSKRAPFGDLDHFVVTFDPTFRDSVYGGGATLLDRAAKTYTPHTQFGFRAGIGAAFSYFDISLGFSYSSGSWVVAPPAEFSGDSNLTPVSTAKFSELEPNLRVGLRLPLGRFALRPFFAQIGPSFVSGSGITAGYVDIQGGFGLDWAFSCDWSVHADGGPGYLFLSGGDGSGGLLSLGGSLGIGFTPSSSCRDEHNIAKTPMQIGLGR